MLLSGCIWERGGGQQSTAWSLQKKFIRAQSSIQEKSSWPSSHLENWPEGHDGQGDVHLNILSTFEKHLERLFTPKYQDNSEKTAPGRFSEIWP